MPDYTKIKRLGEGNFGEVWLVYDRALGTQSAKIFVPRKRVSDPTNFYKEPQTLMELNHENIVAVKDAGKLGDGTLYIAMEYLERGSIEDVYKGAPVPLSTALKYIIDICWAVEYAHSNGYIHRDIKPANILLTTNNDAKLSDFGLATRVPKGSVASPYGYLTHLAPEVISTGQTSIKSDVYALGVTAYRIINGDGYLSHISDHDEILDLILEGTYPERNHYRPYVPIQVKKVVNRCMAVNERDRFQSTAEFRKAIESIRLLCDWSIFREGKLIKYITKINTTNIQVSITPLDNNHFDITTSKKVGDGKERRILKDCFGNLTRGNMRKKIRSILPRYVKYGC